MLRHWREIAENKISRAIRATGKFRPLAANELLRSDIDIEDLAGLMAMEEFFGCPVECRPFVERVPDGWMRFSGAVVRGDDLIGIEIERVHKKGIRYFQVEHLLDTLSKTKFRRFYKCVVHFVLISEQAPEVDKEAVAKVKEIIKNSPVEAYVRSLRLNTLRAKYNL